MSKERRFDRKKDRGARRYRCCCRGSAGQTSHRRTDRGHLVPCGYLCTCVCVCHVSRSSGSLKSKMSHSSYILLLSLTLYSFNTSSLYPPFIFQHMYTCHPYSSLLCTNNELKQGDWDDIQLIHAYTHTRTQIHTPTHTFTLSKSGSVVPFLGHPWWSPPDGGGGEGA